MWPIERTAIGRIVVAPSVPEGFALFYTTSDFPGRLTHDIALDLSGVVKSRFGVAATLSTCTQVHGAAIRGAERSNPWRECDSCDALWSAQPGVALGIKVADCLPISIIDAPHHVTANVHSGWRGAVKQIARVALEELRSHTAFDASSASAWMGPAIRACCFEVGEEVVDEFAASYGDVTAYVDRSRGKPHVNVPRLTADLLQRHGFSAGRIYDSGLCTRCPGSIFHSYRRDGRGSGRNLAIVAH